MSDTSGHSKSLRRDSAVAVETTNPAEETILDPSDNVSGESQASRQSNVHPNFNDSLPVSITRLFQFNRSDQLVIGIAAILALVMVSVFWAQLSGWGMQPIEIEEIPTRQYDYRFDINSAEWIEWVQMQGIGVTVDKS